LSRQFCGAPTLARTTEPPGPRSTHGLSEWKCDQPELPLEKCHELLAHFGNSGMNKHLSDILSTLEGATEFNIRMRWKAKVSKRKSDGEMFEMFEILFSFDELPRHYDNSFLQHLNKLTQNCGGLPPVFDDVHQVHKNNGEVCLSKYFAEQMEQNKIMGQDKKTAICLCPMCTTHMLKNEQTRSFAPEDDNDDDMDDNDNNEK
jgi:hypothetical protein